MSAALLQDANKQHTIADSLESALHVLTWTALRYIPHTMASAFLNLHLRMVYDEYCTLTGTGGRLKGLSLAARQYVPRALQLEQPSPLLDLLETMSDPFVAVYGVEPDESTKYTQMEDQKDLLETFYKRRLERSKSPGWFQKTIEAALNDTWPMDDGSSELLCQVQRARSPDEVNIPKRPR